MNEPVKYVVSNKDTIAGIAIKFGRNKIQSMTNQVSSCTVLQSHSPPNSGGFGHKFTPAGSVEQDVYSETHWFVVKKYNEIVSGKLIIGMGRIIFESSLKTHVVEKFGITSSSFSCFYEDVRRSIIYALTNSEREIHHIPNTVGENHILQLVINREKNKSLLSPTEGEDILGLPIVIVGGTPPEGPRKFSHHHTNRRTGNNYSPLSGDESYYFIVGEKHVQHLYRTLLRHLPSNICDFRAKEHSIQIPSSTPPKHSPSFFEEIEHTFISLPPSYPPPPLPSSGSKSLLLPPISSPLPLPQPERPPPEKQSPSNSPSTLLGDMLDNLLYYIPDFSILDEFSGHEETPDVPTDRNSDSVTLPRLNDVHDHAANYEASHFHTFDQPKNLPTSFIPQVDRQSLVLTEKDRIQICGWLPERLQLSDWILLYGTQQHGISLNTFYHNTEEKGPSIVVIRTNKKNVFGGFASESWKKTSGFYGTGESFLFQLHPTPHTFSWTEKTHHFQYSTEDSIAMGGGGGTFGFWLDSEFYHGTSAPCITFGNPQLSDQEQFIAIYVEVWGFQEVED
eukprot:TRINITY_DN7200_c0_g1_i6.p1 TRINITY_DN7200_c0_g1~~TRINITY_DN7200_c0_g1_i6.p1  ORF type:complete len:591 (-),score=128.19 TRINITY_DN7200_c0_g1_i6:117-1805(-)